MPPKTNTSCASAPNGPRASRQPLQPSHPSSGLPAIPEAPSSMRYSSHVPSFQYHTAATNRTGLYAEGHLHQGHRASPNQAFLEQSTAPNGYHFTPQRPEAFPGLSYEDMAESKRLLLEEDMPGPPPTEEDCRRQLDFNWKSLQILESQRAHINELQAQNSWLNSELSSRAAHSAGPSAPSDLNKEEHRAPAQSREEYFKYVRSQDFRLKEEWEKLDQEKLKFYCELRRMRTEGYSEYLARFPPLDPSKLSVDSPNARIMIPPSTLKGDGKNMPAAPNEADDASEDNMEDTRSSDGGDQTQEPTSTAPLRKLPRDACTGVGSGVPPWGTAGVIPITEGGERVVPPPGTSSTSWAEKARGANPPSGPLSRAENGRR